MGRWRGLVAVLLLAAGLLVVSASPAMASCHHFTVSVAPASVVEGGSVTVTVTRDGDQADSSVRLSTVAGSASSGSDFNPVTNLTVAFGNNQLSRSFGVGTVQDTTPEGDEQFRMHLSNGAGCPVSTSYQYGPDATITIVTDDATTTTSSTTTSSTTSSTSSTTSSTTSTTAPTTTTADDGATDEEAGPTTTIVAAGEGLREEGGGSWTLPLALGALLLVFLSGALFARHRIVAGERDEGGDEP